MPISWGRAVGAVFAGLLSGPPVLAERRDTPRIDRRDAGQERRIAPGLASARLWHQTPDARHR